MQRDSGANYFPDDQQAVPSTSTNTRPSSPSNRASITSTRRSASFQGPILTAQSEVVEREDDLWGVGGVGSSPENGGNGVTQPTQDARKRGGRPRDKVWEFFQGDHSLATCNYCEWKSEHPKPFRMKAHVLTQCEGIPEESKREFSQYEEEKVKAKRVWDEDHGQDKASAQGGVEAVGTKREGDEEANVETGAGGPSTSTAKKAKRGQASVRTALPPPSLPSNMTPSTGSSVAQSPAAPAPRSPITCHVLDSTTGKPAPDMRIRLDRLNTSGFVLQGQGITDKDGRCGTLLNPGMVLEVGIFKITFFTSEYFNNRGVMSFYPFVEIPFEVRSPDEHYHIPCLLAPHSYTTYRGS
ncbi:hydroxyisourate hydrolase [Sporobolomyces salmoneus]|uniref:hydroxyisourate hydrolase n=1 Tax=Sporobolomyces salmoneus TaxID=183962 RepID=UPI00316E8B3A